MGKKPIFLTTIVLVLALFNILNPIVKNWSKLNERFDPKIYEKKYNRSQYIIPRSKNPISDEELLSYAGYKYATGLNPVLINSDHPPLGKYIIGWFILLTDNSHSVAIFFALGIILLLLYLVYILTNSYLLTTVSLLLLSFDTVFIDQIIHSPVLDIIQVFFLLLYIFFYFHWLSKKNNLFIVLMGISFGALASVKLYFPALILLLVTSSHLILTKRGFKNTLIISSTLLTLACTTYTASYLSYFAHGNSFRNFLSTQKWIFLFWKNNSIEVVKYYGAVIPFILFNQWKVWWGDKQYINFEHWSIFWPIFFVAGIFCAVYFISKAKKKHFKGFSSFLSVWIIVFTVYLCFIPISPRYLMMLYFPIYILIVLFLKIKFKNL